MKFCAAHWQQLRDAIDARGLTTLVSENGEDVVRKMRRQHEEKTTTVDTFDPLMGAHTAIMHNALHVGGLAIMAPNLDGSERCPICYLSALDCPDHGVPHPELYAQWIDRAADDMLAQWRSFSHEPEGRSD